MQHPDPSKIRDAMALLSCYEKSHKTSVDMRASHLLRDGCGTVACFAGHFHAAECFRDNRGHDFSPYFSGARSFSEHIFPSRDGGWPWWADGHGIVRVWAERNPDLWGNEYGFYCLSGALSYHGVCGETEITLRHIIDHWLGVAGRIEAHNATS